MILRFPHFRLLAHHIDALDEEENHIFTRAENIETIGGISIVPQDVEYILADCPADAYSFHISNEFVSLNEIF